MEDFNPQSSFECIHLDITDELLSSAKIASYMFNQQFENSEGKEKPFTPKAFPGKAVVIVLPLDGFNIEIYLDSDNLMWDSKFVFNGRFGKLSPEQMQQFFSSGFYLRMIDALSKKWPTSDPTYAKLFNAVCEKRLRVGVIPSDELIEMENCGQLTEIEHHHRVNQPHKRVELANKDTTGDGKRDYSGSGRKIVQFSDQGVSSREAKYFCWPRRGKEFKWNTWKDWEKITPFCRMEFKHNGREYMISMTRLNVDNLDNRGFRGGDLDWEPPFAWLTPDEVSQVMKLSIVQKFLRQCRKRLKKYLDMTPEEVYEKIDKKERVTLKEIEKTQRVIRANIRSIISKSQIDNYKYD